MKEKLVEKINKELQKRALQQVLNGGTSSKRVSAEVELSEEEIRYFNNINDFQNANYIWEINLKNGVLNITAIASSEIKNLLDGPK